MLEAAKFDGCFFADLFGLYDLHQGSFDAYVRRGGQISYLDPTVVLPVMAAATAISASAPRFPPASTPPTTWRAGSARWTR